MRSQPGSTATLPNGNDGDDSDSDDEDEDGNNADGSYLELDWIWYGLSIVRCCW
jgi:hypothetical protein